MFVFKTEQRILEVSGVRVGGQPGQLPTVLIGSIFHRGHRIVEDRGLGLFDKRRAEKLIRVQDEVSEKTGNPCMVDVVGETVESLTRYIDFVSEITQAPILVNGSNAEVRVAASKHAVNIGIRDRIAYNSINYTLNDRELRLISDMGLKTAIIQGFNPRDPRPRGMVAILKRLLNRAREAGVEKPLLLTPVLDIPSIGTGARGVNMVKGEFGLPTGTVPVGVIGRLRRSKTLSEEVKRLFRASAVTLAQVAGADFIIYGSLAKARSIFPVCALVDAIVAYTAREFGVKPMTRRHPIYRMANVLRA